RRRGAAELSVGSGECEALVAASDEPAVEPRVERGLGLVIMDVLCLAGWWCAPHCGTPSGGEVRGAAAGGTAQCEAAGHSAPPPLCYPAAAGPGTRDALQQRPNAHGAFRRRGHIPRGTRAGARRAGASPARRRAGTRGG